MYAVWKAMMAYACCGFIETVPAEFQDQLENFLRLVLAHPLAIVPG
jgi:hypothetical protein